MDILKKYREQINKIDNQIVKLIKKRVKIVRIIGDFKKKNNIKMYDKKREREIFKELEIKSMKNNLNKNHVKNIFSEILKYSRRIQK